MALPWRIACQPVLSRRLLRAGIPGGIGLKALVMTDDLFPKPPTPAPTLEESMRSDWEAIGRTRMPFGKFGPAHFPPHGLPIYDLPAEYLAWFEHKATWPKGRLGKLLRMVYQMKVDGSDSAFEPFRRCAGGRSQLHPERQRDFHFPANESDIHQGKL